MRVKILLFIGLLSLGFNGLFAQSKFRFGIHVTPTISYVSTNQESAATGAKILFGYGGIFEYRFAQNYSLASGFEIINRGGTLTADSATGSYRTGYLQFPLAIKMRTREFGYFTYFGEFGLVPSFKTADNAEFEPSLPEAERLDSYVNFFNTIFRFGLGTEYDLGGSSAIVFGVNYNRSLFDNLKADDPRLSSKYTYRFDYLAFTVGFLF